MKLRIEQNFDSAKAKELDALLDKAVNLADELQLDMAAIRILEAKTILAEEEKKKKAA